MEKLNTGIDWVNAEITTERTAIIKGISQNYEIGLDDLVLYDNKKRVTQIIKKNTNTIFARYLQKINALEIVTKHFNAHDIKIESPYSGIIGLAIPVSLEEEDFEIIFNTCPIACEFLISEKSENESNDNLEEGDLDDFF